MRMRVVSILPNVTSRVLAITIFTTLQGVTVLAADHCITKPDFRATQGGHWYYHFDAVKNHKCWFLREQGVQARQVLQESPSSAEAVPESNSSLSSLLAFASPSESRERAQSGSATSNSTDAVRRDEALPNVDSEVALRYSHRKLQVSKLQERSSSRSSEKKGSAAPFSIRRVTMHCSRNFSCGRSDRAQLTRSMRVVEMRCSENSCTGTNVNRATSRNENVNLFRGVLRIGRPMRHSRRGCAMAHSSRMTLPSLLARRRTKVAAIALANKIARMAWAMMARGERYKEPFALAA
jgi:hypothetical protein